MTDDAPLATPDFFDADLLDWLLAATPGALDALPFGVVGLDERLMCTDYNAVEAQQAGLPAQRVLGRPFFDQIAPCMNNFLVADKFRESGSLDVTIGYTLSVRVTPTPVTLRLLAREGETRRFLVVDWTQNT